ncbi:restriction endonuclease [Comamonas testosteroni]|uniref:restriction endonuclease n=1 Tax=Comamonas testosteroni TaxID=285 RepID=UPI002E11A0E1|nr:restriction endonuclease [Comamonas testosteroni]
MKSADDINFNLLSPTQFEELCFDLLMEQGFRKLIWRQGGADSGRDIQGTREVVSGLIEPFEETWFFECKRYENGVPPEDLNSKITWADAERPKHLVFFISSYITNNARTWLDAIRRDKFYEVHLIEGKQLQHLVLNSPSLIARYFSSDVQKLMQQAHRAWVLHNLIPEPWLIRTLAETENLAEYEPGQLAFLWASLKMRFVEMNANMADSWGESYDIMFSMLKRHANTVKPVLGTKGDWLLLDEQEGSTDYDVVYPKVYAAQIAHLKDQVEYIALYSLVRDEEGEGLEVLVDQDSSLTYHIRHVPEGGARDALSTAKMVLHS